MSHFSKIKTNITDLSALIKTICQLGFSYQLLDDVTQDINIKNLKESKNLSVYDLNAGNPKVPAFNFIWNGEEYVLIADVQLWSLDVDFNHLLDRIFQQYAYNVVLSKSTVSGFNKVQEEVSYDGSIKLTLQRWNYS